MAEPGVLTFQIGGRPFAVDLALVRAVLPSGHVTPIPGAPREVLGLVNVRGMLAAAIDLGLLLTGEPHELRAGDALVLLEAPPQPWSEGQPARVAIPVERVLDVVPTGGHATAPLRVDVPRLLQQV